MCDIGQLFQASYLGNHIVIKIKHPQIVTVMDIVLMKEGNTGSVMLETYKYLGARL